MNVFDMLQLCGGLILAVGYIPQILQIIRTNSCADLNLKTYVAMAVGISLMEIYAAHLAMDGTGQMFLTTNSISLALVLLICTLIIAIRRRKK